MSALCSTLANVADATQSARFLVSLLEPGAFAIALSRDGAVTPLAGVETHPLLDAGAQLPRLAHAITSRDGRRRTRFLWPADDRRWHRVGDHAVPVGGARRVRRRRVRAARDDRESSSPAASSRC